MENNRGITVVQTILAVILIIISTLCVRRHGAFEGWRERRMRCDGQHCYARVEVFQQGDDSGARTW